MTYNCAICYDDFEQKQNNHFKCQYCDYYYCVDCLEDYINNFKFKPTIFPQLTCSNCDNIISYDLILPIVKEQALENLLNKVRETIRENTKFIFTEEIRDYMKKFIIPTNDVKSYVIAPAKLKSYKDIVNSIEQIPNLVYNYNTTITNKVNITPGWFNRFVEDAAYPRNFMKAILPICDEVVTPTKNTKTNENTTTNTNANEVTTTNSTIEVTNQNTNTNTNEVITTEDSELTPVVNTNENTEEEEYVYMELDDEDIEPTVIANPNGTVSVNSKPQTKKTTTNTTTKVINKANYLKRMKVVSNPTTEYQQQFINILKLVCDKYVQQAVCVDRGALTTKNYIAQMTNILKDFVCEVVSFAKYIESSEFVELLYKDLIVPVYKLIFDEIMHTTPGKTQKFNYRTLIRNTQPHQLNQHFMSTSRTINDEDGKPKIMKKTVFKCEICVTGVVVVSDDDSSLECDSCGQSYCRDCGKLKDDKQIHKCVRADVETFDNILKTTRSCPKCGARIYKQSGCNDMFCTICHIGFDWATGNIITRSFHNPHRSDYISSLNDDQRLAMLRANVSDNEDDLIREYIFSHPNNIRCDYLKDSSVLSLAETIIRIVTMLRPHGNQESEQRLIAEIKTIEFLHEMHLARQAIANPKTKALYTKESLHNIVEYKCYDDLEYNMELDNIVEKFVDRFVYSGICKEILRVLIRPAVVIDQYMIVGFNRHVDDIKAVINSVLGYFEESIVRLRNMMKSSRPKLSSSFTIYDFTMIHNSINIYKALNFNQDSIYNKYDNEMEMVCDIDNIIKSNLQKDCNKEVIDIINKRVKPTVNPMIANYNENLLRFTCNIFNGHPKECHKLLKNEFFGVIYYIFKNVLFRKYNNFYDSDYVEKTAMILYMYIHDEDVSSEYKVTSKEKFEDNYKYVSSFLLNIDRHKKEIDADINLQTCLLRYLHLYDWTNDVVKYYLSRSSFVVRNNNKK